MAAQNGRYVIGPTIGSGGMGRVHLGRLDAAGGFRRHVAIKRLHPHFSVDPRFVEQFLQEARLVSAVSHPNAVSTLDVLWDQEHVFIVLDYVRGLSLAAVQRALERAGTPQLPLPIALALTVDALRGLHAAHQATDTRGERLGLVHRDVSPQNILVGEDGFARILDFGIAKAVARYSSELSDRVAGKLPYMAPEQLHGPRVDHRADLFAAALVLHDSLSGLRPKRDAAMRARQREDLAPLQSAPQRLREVLWRALAPCAEDRFASAQEMAAALSAVAQPASPQAIGEWLHASAGRLLDERRALEHSWLEAAPSSKASGPDEATEAHTLDALALTGAAKAHTFAGTTDAHTLGGDTHAHTLGGATDADALTLRQDTIRLSGDTDWVTAGEPHNQVQRSPHRRRMLFAAAIGIAVLVAGIGLAPSGQAPRMQSAVGELARLLSQRPAQQAPTTAAPSSGPLPSASGPITTGTIPPSSRASSSPSSPMPPSARPQPQPSRPAPQRRPKPNCQPPYTLLENGARRYKPECF